MDNQMRTLGDGMDSSLINLSEASNFSISTNFTPSKNILKSLTPVEAKSKKFILIPKYIPKERKLPKYLVKTQKEPKFIPYEPYKAAVEPIKTKKKVPSLEIKTSKNNVEIQHLVAQMSTMRSIEINKTNIDILDEDDCMVSRKQCEKEKEAYETDIKNLRETNAHLENQLKFQAQVNSELKTLLVAAVGEDLESRVQHLTEDKLQLARALLNSANHLTSHQEQTEWLSGQCEVWRSKFLASSLMVEELARWKSALSNRIHELQECVKVLLEERLKIQKFSLKTHCHLENLINHTTKEEKTKPPLKSANILELTKNNCDVSEYLHTLLNVPKENNFNPPFKVSHTIAEKTALKWLQNPVSITNKQDALCNAVMGAAMSISGEQMYLQYPSFQATCCSHCKGDIQII